MFSVLIYYKIQLIPVMEKLNFQCPWSIINIENSCAAFNIFVETFIYY